MKSILPILALLGPSAFALPEFDTRIVDQCRAVVEYQIAATNRACPARAVLGDVTDVDGNRYAVDFKQPGCGVSGEVELTFGRHEQTEVSGKTVIPRCEVLRFKITELDRD